jgi:hypothetical protein
MVCIREGCSNQTSGKYCSKECYYQRKKAKVRISSSNPYHRIPQDVQSRLASDQSEAESLMLAEVNEQVRGFPPSLSMTKTFGDWQWSRELGWDYRPITSLDFDKIDELLKIGPVLFALYMKAAPPIAAFRDEDGWSLDSPDQELVDIGRASLLEIMPRMALDLVASMSHGYAPFEQMWTNTDKYSLGLSKSRGSSALFSVPELPKAINPNKIDKILRLRDGSFNGMEVIQDGGNVKLSAQESLILTYGQRYRSLWGTSFLEPIYALGYWTQVVTRAMVRFLERAASPVTVTEYPENTMVRAVIDGKEQQVSSIKAAMVASTDAAYRNAIAIPSSRDHNGDQKWKIYYLESKAAVDQFHRGLETLNQDIFRAGLSPELSLARASGGTGSYNQGDIHRALNLIHSDMILTEWIWGMNKWWIPRISEYNRGQNGPPVRMRAQQLDRDKRTLLMEFLRDNTQSEGYQEFAARVDWSRIATSVNIPTVSENEFKKRLRDKAKANAERPPSPLEAEVDRNQRTIESLRSNGAVVLSESEWHDIERAITG